MKNNKSKELMQKFSIFFVLLVLIIVSSVMNPNFLSHRNITNIAVQLAVATILASAGLVLGCGACAVGCAFRQCV